MGHALGRGVLGIHHGFTPTPTRASDGNTYETEGGVPGTYCPIPARAGEKAMSTPADLGMTETPQMSTAPAPADSGNDLLLPLPPAKCTVPATAPSARPIVP